MENFRALGLSENVLAALQKKGWEQPSPIQEKTIPLLLAGVGLIDLGLASTACQVRYGHREARRLGLMERRSMRLRRDFVFCGMLDAFTFAVTPMSANVAFRW